MLAEIEAIAFGTGLSDTDRVQLIQDLLTNRKEDRTATVETLDNFKEQSLSPEDADYWLHINLHGEYDAWEERLRNSVGLRVPKNLGLEALENREENNAATAAHWNTSENRYAILRIFVGLHLEPRA